MGDPGTPSDPNQPGWASPTPTPPPEPAPAAPAPPTPPTAPTPPVPAAPGPGGPGPGAPVRRRRLTWLWILIPVLLVFLASLVLVIVFAVRLFVGPIDATNDYFALLRDQRFAEAYGDRCDAFQAQVSLEEFEANERRNRIIEFDFEELDIDDDDRATTEGTVVRSDGSFRVTVHLERDGGDWKVCSVEGER